MSVAEPTAGDVIRALRQLRADNTAMRGAPIEEWTRQLLAGEYLQGEPSEELVAEMLGILERAGLGLRSPTLQPCALEFYWDYERDRLAPNIDLSMSVAWTDAPMFPGQGDLPESLTQEKSPLCTDLITDPRQVLENKARWPAHLCIPEFLEQSTALWATDRPIASDSPNRWRWASMYPLPVGRRALMTCPEMSDISAWSEVLDVLPFDEYEQAMWVLRVEDNWRATGMGALDIFGLASYPTDLHHRLDYPVAGDLAYVVRGQGRRMLELLDAAEKWWHQFRGLALKGRPQGTGTWRDHEHFLNAAKEAVASIRSGGGKVTQERVAEHLLTQDRQLRRWIEDFDTTWGEIRIG
jgi:hypothetical protein